MDTAVTGTGPSTGTDPLAGTIDGLREQLAEATEIRKGAAKRARYIRHAIENLESGRARTSAPTPVEEEPGGGLLGTSSLQAADEYERFTDGE